MADKLDVAGRLAEARPAVENTQCYVWACHLLGYQNADLTTHSAQIRDWSSGEEGMDLHVLDADCEAISAAAAAADDALGRQRDQLTRLAAAWQGSAGSSAGDFVRRHCDAAENVTASVRAAADALAGLRDALWQAVDTEAAALTEIDDRRQGERSAWLAAAQTVNTGVGDRAAASELVDQQVKPYVDNDIRVDWLTAVRTAMASIGGSYDTAAGEISSSPPAQFDIPGDFGTDPAPDGDDDGPPPRDPAPSTAAASASPSPAAPPPYPPSYPTAPAPYPNGAASYPTAAAPLPPMGANPLAAAPVPSAQGFSSPLGEAPSLPASLGQLDGLPRRFADALSGLTTAAEDPVIDPPDPASAVHDDATRDDDPAPGEDAESRDDENDCGAGEHTRDEKPASNTEVDEPVDEPVSGPPQVPPPPAPAPAPPEPTPPPPAPPPPPPAVDGSATPCEIAASELPQAGQ